MDNIKQWTSDFNPSKFLSRVNLNNLLKRNEAYNESHVNNANKTCILCGKHHNSGIILNDKSFLCQNCYLEVSTISYPERYEEIFRQHLKDVSARELAYKDLSDKFEASSDLNSFIYLGWGSLILVLINLNFLILSCILLLVGYSKLLIDKEKFTKWVNIKKDWETNNPIPNKPEIKEFTDPDAILSYKDKIIFKIFNNWPGYPPFWHSLKAYVLLRDSNRCQVTGCPSRLSLHVHHIKAVSEGGTHTPENLMTLCEFHHALEPVTGHERIWGRIKNLYFTLVCEHERRNPTAPGYYVVRTHLRRLQLITLRDLREITTYHGFCCPYCKNKKISFTLHRQKNIITIECPQCQKIIQGPQQLSEETGPLLAEILGVTRNTGKWKARWDVLSTRRSTTWGSWKSKTKTQKRETNHEESNVKNTSPLCPFCGAPMKLVHPRPGDHWKSFWGCTKFRITGCKGSKKF